jgi:hypothetical protein
MDAVDEDDDDDGVASHTTLVFLRITWHRGVLGPTVVARCTDILLAMVPCFPKTVPSALMSNASESTIGCSGVCVSRPEAWLSRVRHSRSSLTVQAVIMISYNSWSQRKTSFQE